MLPLRFYGISVSPSSLVHKHDGMIHSEMRVSFITQGAIGRPAVTNYGGTGQNPLFY